MLTHSGGPATPYANAHRGEVVVEVGGERRRACLTLGALAEIETGLGVDGLAAVAERMKALSARDLMVLLVAVLRGGGEATPDVATADPREAAVAVAQAFAAAAR